MTHVFIGLLTMTWLQLTIFFKLEQIFSIGHLNLQTNKLFTLFHMNLLMKDGSKLRFKDMLLQYLQYDAFLKC